MDSELYYLILEASCVMLLFAFLAGCATGGAESKTGNPDPEAMEEKLYYDADVPSFETVCLDETNCEYKCENHIIRGRSS